MELGGRETKEEEDLNPYFPRFLDTIVDMFALYPLKNRLSHGIDFKSLYVCVWVWA